MNLNQCRGEISWLQEVNLLLKHGAFFYSNKILVGNSLAHSSKMNNLINEWFYELCMLPWPQSRLFPLSLHRYSLPQTTGWGTSLRKVAALHSGLCSLGNGDQRYLLRKKRSVYSNAGHLKATKRHKYTQYSRMDTKSPMCYIS